MDRNIEDTQGDGNLAADVDGACRVVVDAAEYNGASHTSFSSLPHYANDGVGEIKWFHRPSQTAAA